MVGNCLTFAVGPKLLDDEDSPDEDEQDGNKQDGNKQNGNGQSNGHAARDEEEANPTNSEGRTAEEEEDHVTESTTLLPDAVARREAHAEQDVSKGMNRHWAKLPSSIRRAFGFIGSLVNAPLIGAGMSLNPSYLSATGSSKLSLFHSDRGIPGTRSTTTQGLLQRTRRGGHLQGLAHDIGQEHWRAIPSTSTRSRGREAK